MARPQIRFSATALVALAAAAAMAMTACASGSSTTTTSPSADANASGANLPTVVQGKLTIATGEPAYSPWVLNNAPESGEGYEAAVAYAIAEQMGFTKDAVQWTRTSFDAAIAPGAKDWDFNLQQFSITEERKNAVDFSSPYYTTSQAVVALKNGKGSNAKSVADLADLQIGVQSGTTSQIFVSGNVKTNQAPLIFNSSIDVVQALKGGQVDAIVVDLPTAFNIIATQVEEGTIVGQFADTTDGDNYGLVLPKGSALTPAVTKAVDALRESGKLAEIQKKWLSESVSVPVLK